MKKFILSTALAIFVLTLSPNQVFAAATLLPTHDDISEMTEADCAQYIDWVVENELSAEQILSGTDDARDGILGCAIKSGNIKFWMVPYFVRYIMEWVIGLSGLIAVLMIIIGGYYYIAGGITDDKEKGKKIIQYALGGMALATLSWIIVNIILLGITG